MQAEFRSLFSGKKLHLMGLEIWYVINEFTGLLKHSPGGTVGSHKKPQDITASNTSNNGNGHLPNTSLNQLQKVLTLTRHNYSTAIGDLFLKASYRRKLLNMGYLLNQHSQNTGNIIMYIYSK